MLLRSSLSKDISHSERTTQNSTGFSSSCQNVTKHDTTGTTRIDIMDPDPGADIDLRDGAGLEACGGAPEGSWDEAEREGEWLLNVKGGDGAFSSASTSSDSSLPSSSSTRPPVFSSVPPICAEDEKEMLSGCSKSFTGLKLFTRR